MQRRTINSQTGNSQTEYGFIDVRYANTPKQKTEGVGVGEEEVAFEAKTVEEQGEAEAEGKGARVLEKGGLTREQGQVGEKDTRGRGSAPTPNMLHVRERVKSNLC